MMTDKKCDKFSLISNLKCQATLFTLVCNVNKKIGESNTISADKYQVTLVTMLVMLLPTTVGDVITNYSW